MPLLTLYEEVENVPTNRLKNALRTGELIISLTGRRPRPCNPDERKHQITIIDASKASIDRFPQCTEYGTRAGLGPLYTLD